MIYEVAPSDTGGKLRTEVEKVLVALNSVDLNNLNNLSQELKEIIGSGLLNVKYEMATLVFNYHTAIAFEVTTISKELMTEVVETVYGKED